MAPTEGRVAKPERLWGCAMPPQASPRIDSNSSYDNMHYYATYSTASLFLHKPSNAAASIMHD